MRRFSIYTISALTAITTLICGGCQRESEVDSKIRCSLERHMSSYPQSTLRDLYKNYFQDNYGPGHIISDKSAADRYLRYELETSKSFEGADYEPTGYEGRFYRVNLSVIKDGRVGYDKYLDAFVRSVNGIKQPTIEEWRKQWNHIDSMIGAMGLQLPDIEQDRALIDSILEAGNVVMHHSQRFSEHYDPHYRIIERGIFEREIMPLINRE